MEETSRGKDEKENVKEVDVVRLFFLLYIEGSLWAQVIIFQFFGLYLILGNWIDRYVDVFNLYKMSQHATKNLKSKEFSSTPITMHEN